MPAVCDGGVLLWLMIICGCYYGCVSDAKFGGGREKGRFNSDIMMLSTIPIVDIF